MRPSFHATFDCRLSSSPVHRRPAEETSVYGIARGNAQKKGNRSPIDGRIGTVAIGRPCVSYIRQVRLPFGLADAKSRARRRTVPKFDRLLTIRLIVPFYCRVAARAGLSFFFFFFFYQFLVRLSRFTRLRARVYGSCMVSRTIRCLRQLPCVSRVVGLPWLLNVAIHESPSASLPRVLSHKNTRTR